MRKSSLQQRIAVRFIISTALLTLLLCTIMLICFWQITEAIPVGRSLDVSDVRHIFFQLLVCCGVADGFILALLFFLARRMARDSIRPVTDIISTARSITYTTLDVRMSLPEHQDELYELAETINSLLDRISSAMEREKSFTSYASHEFRTPLAVLKGRMEVLMRKPRSEEEYKKGFAECIAEVDKLNAMVEQLLLFSRCESGRQQLKYSTLRLMDVVNASLSDLSDSILHRQLQMSLNFSQDDMKVVTDERCFSAIVSNLLSNAVKYANEGGTVSIYADESNDGMLVRISNTGKGLTDEQLSHVFDKFYRSHETSGTASKGFGLGLPIAKQCCEMLGIKLNMESQPSELTTVTLHIPKEPW